MNEEDFKSMGMAIPCPKCGRVAQRSFRTDSLFHCGKCGYDFYGYSEEGVVVLIRQDLLRGGQRFEKYKALMHGIDRLSKELE